MKRSLHTLIFILSFDSDTLWGRSWFLFSFSQCNFCFALHGEICFLLNLSCRQRKTWWCSQHDWRGFVKPSLTVSGTQWQNCSLLSQQDGKKITSGCGVRGDINQHIMSSCLPIFLLQSKLPVKPSGSFNASNSKLDALH